MHVGFGRGRLAGPSSLLLPPSQPPVLARDHGNVLSGLLPPRGLVHGELDLARDQRVDRVVPALFATGKENEKKKSTSVSRQPNRCLKQNTHTLTMPTLFPGWNFVPLCLTMMFPGMTYSPPNFFTPKYFGFESLPFLLVPPAFFVAVLCQPRNPKLLAAALTHSQENKVCVCSWDCPPNRPEPENSFVTRERTPTP